MFGSVPLRTLHAVWMRSTGIISAATVNVASAVAVVAVLVGIAVLMLSPCTSL
jgi:hypothetical protein